MKQLLALRTIAIVSVMFTSAALAQSSDRPRGTAVEQDVSKTSILTRTQFEELLAKPQQLLIIDVRRPDELTALGGFPVYLSTANR